MGRRGKLMSEEVKNRLADKIENYASRHGISISDTYALLIALIEENIGTNPMSIYGFSDEATAEINDRKE